MKVRVRHFFAKWRWRALVKVRPIGLGVRVLVTHGDAVLLVRHTYQEGWYMAGGGVERRETLAGAAARELLEECGVQFKAPPRLLHMFFSERQDFSDHIGFFHAEAASNALVIDPFEIAEAKFFRWGEWPDGISPATLRRLAEFRDQLPHPERW